MVDRSSLDAPGLLTQCYEDARQIAEKHDVTQTTVLLDMLVIAIERDDERIEAAARGALDLCKLDGTLPSRPRALKLAG